MEHMLTSLFKKVNLDQKKKVALKWNPNAGILVNVDNTIKYLKKVLVLENKLESATVDELAEFIGQRAYDDDEVVAIKSILSSEYDQEKCVAKFGNTVKLVSELEGKNNRTSVPLQATVRRKDNLEDIFFSVSFVSDKKHRFQKSWYYYTKYSSYLLFGIDYMSAYAFMTLFSAMEEEVADNKELSSMLREFEDLYLHGYHHFLSSELTDNLAKVNDFIQEFILRVYGDYLQIQRERQMNGITRASAWVTKKNINKSTKQAMKNSSLNKRFSKLEFDNSVDLYKLPDFEYEVNRVIENVLPIPANKPELRLRKLGNYKAVGMYVGGLYNTICIDFRDSNDVDHGYRTYGSGIQSFIHEYAHYLDYQWLRSVDSSTPSIPSLSSQPEFRALYKDYVRKFYELKGKAIMRECASFQEQQVFDKIGYFTTPTEVLARAFEVYLSELKLDSSLLKTSYAYRNDIVYRLFDRKLVKEYFDKLFPSLATKVSKLNAFKEPDFSQFPVQDKAASVDMSYNPRLKEIKVGNTIEMVLDI